jgi:YVTN family beta-propeller protein
MEFRVLGPFEVVDDGRILQLGSGRQLALVAVLLLHANEAVSVDRLVDELWGESPPPTAAKIVRNSVSLLRRELGDRLVTRPPGYLLRVEEGELDSERLERAVESGDLEQLTAALALWHGSPLPQFAYEPFARDEIARLEELRLAAVEARVDAQLGLGGHAGVIAELEALVRQHPLRERLCGQLMLALYRSGRQAEALETYQRARRSLDEQLGIEPGPALKELERKVLNQDESLAAPRTAVPRALSGLRRPMAFVAAAFVLAALVAVAATAFVLTRDSAGGLNAVRPNHVGVIDPETNEIVAAIPVGAGPGPVAAGAGSVWIANLQDRNLTRIDPRQRSVTAVVSLDDRTPTGLAVGPDAVWVAHGLRGELSRVTPEFGRVAQTIAVTGRSSTGSVAVGAGFVWVVYGDSTLARIQPESARRDGATLTGSIPAGIVVVGRSVWVANFGDSTVQLFDPITFEVGPVRTISVGRRPAAIAFGEGALWVANRGDDSVTRIDPSTSSAINIRVGDEPAAVAVGAGAVWVSNSGDRTVSRIDPAIDEVAQTFEFGSAPAGIAVAEGLVWVAAQAP